LSVNLSYWTRFSRHARGDDGILNVVLRLVGGKRTGVALRLEELPDSISSWLLRNKFELEAGLSAKSVAWQL
jgi:hypothetical protein